MREWIRSRPGQAAAAPLTEADLHEAYARGRRDERARRRRSPLAFLTASLAVLAVAGMLASSAWQGVFAGPQGGLDDRIADATIVAQARLTSAAAEARDLLGLGRTHDGPRNRSAIGG